jgi:thioredoxin-like negative regulator of GroEL
MADVGGEPRAADDVPSARDVFVSYASKDEFGGARRQLIETLVFSGRTADATPEIAQLSDATERSYYKAYVCWIEGRREESTALMMSLKRNPANADYLAMLHAFRGETDEAFQELRKALADKYYDRDMLLYDRHLASLHGDPRFAELANEFRL